MGSPQTCNFLRHLITRCGVRRRTLTNRTQNLLFIPHRPISFSNKSFKTFSKVNVIFASGVAAILGGSVYFHFKQDGVSSKNGILLAKSVEAKPKPKTKTTAPKEEVGAKFNNDENLPESIQYLIIGAGTAGMSAAKAIRAKDPRAHVMIIGEEMLLPYMRPPLSKELWWTNTQNLDSLKFLLWNGKARSIFYEKPMYFCHPSELQKMDYGGVALLSGHLVTHLDVQKKIAFLKSGKSIKYDKCLIATGGKPKNLSAIANASPEVRDKVTRFRTVGDFQRLSTALKKDVTKNVAVIGGGYLGTELAIALAHRGSSDKFKLIQVLPESGVLDWVLPHYLSAWTTKKVENEGVTLKVGTSLESATMKNGKVLLKLTSGEELLVDHVVQAVGLAPYTHLAKASNLEIDTKCGGILVNAELQARTDIWAAGDCACFYDIKLGRRRMEHHDHAVVSGRLAGENMAGGAKPYWHQSMFWSDLGPTIGFEAIGVVDPSLETVGVFTKASDEDTPKFSVDQTGENIRSVAETEKEADVAAPKRAVTAGEISPKLGFRSSFEPGSIFTKLDPKDELKGVVFYMRKDVIVGVLLWNVFGKMPIARKILRDQVESVDFGELAKLFDIYSLENSDKKEE